MLGTKKFLFKDWYILLIDTYNFYFLFLENSGTIPCAIEENLNAVFSLLKTEYSFLNGNASTGEHTAAFIEQGKSFFLNRYSVTSVKVLRKLYKISRGYL